MSRKAFTILLHIFLLFLISHITPYTSVTLTYTAFLEDMFINIKFVIMPLCLKYLSPPCAHGTLLRLCSNGTFSETPSLI